MQALLEELNRALDSQAQQLEQAAGLSRAMLQAAQQRDAADVQALTAKMQLAMQALERAGRQRQQASSALAKKLGITDSSLSNLAQALRPHAPAAAAQLEQQLARARACIQSLQHTNAQSSGLLQNQLDLVQFQLNILTDAGSGGATYGDHGNEQALYGGARLNLLDTKA